MIPEGVAVGSRKYGVEFASALARMRDGDQSGGVDMAVLSIRAGEYRRPDMLTLPAHLPPDERGQRVLALSRVPADLPLRRDLEEWARENARRAVVAAAGVRTLVLAHRAALLLGDHEAAAFLANHLRFEHRLDPEQAPVSWHDLARWALRVVQEAHAAALPAWVLDRSQSARAFVPRTNEPRRLGDLSRPPVARQDAGDEVEGE